MRVVFQPEDTVPRSRGRTECVGQRESRSWGSRAEATALVQAEAES